MSAKKSRTISGIGQRTLPNTNSEYELTERQLDRVCGAGGDIASLAFLVLMTTQRSASADLQSIMNDVQQVNAQKAALRAQMAKLRG